MIRLLHLLLAANLLVSTMGVGVFEHLCQMRGRAVSLMAPPKSCCSKRAAEVTHCDLAAVAKTASAKTAGTPSISEAPCCQDHASWLQADLDGTAPTLNLISPAPALHVWPVLAKAELPSSPAVASLSLKVVQALRYKPPCPERDVRVRVQSFQI